MVKAQMTRFAFPPRWHYDVLRGLDYFQDCGAPRDERLQDAIELLEQRRRPDGRWLLASGYPGKSFFEMERVNTNMAALVVFPQLSSRKRDSIGADTNLVAAPQHLVGGNLAIDIDVVGAVDIDDAIAALNFFKNGMMSRYLGMIEYYRVAGYAPDGELVRS